MKLRVRVWRCAFRAPNPWSWRQILWRVRQHVLRPPLLLWRLRQWCTTPWNESQDSLERLDMARSSLFEHRFIQKFQLLDHDPRLAVGNGDIRHHRNALLIVSTLPACRLLWIHPVVFPRLFLTLLISVTLSILFIFGAAGGAFTRPPRVGCYPSIPYNY